MERGGGSCVFYQVGGCWTASRSETSGIDWRYSAGPELFECRRLPARRRQRRQALHKPHLRHREALWIQEPLLHRVRGRIGEETPGGSADASEEGRKVGEGAGGGGEARVG